MCTVSWMHQGDGYVLFSNRDEKLVRPVALPPRVQERDGVRYIAPIDSAYGGTWIAANELGVSLALVNGPGDKGRGQRSRGWVVTELATVRSAVEAEFRLSECDLTCYAPFTLVVLEPHQDGLLAEWNGKWLVLMSADERMPLASSSFDHGGVRKKRLLQFDRFDRNEAGLRRFHTSHADGPSAYSPCMHRSDARTVSFTSVQVTNQQIQMRYQPGSPCEGRPESEVTLCCNYSSLLPAHL